MARRPTDSKNWGGARPGSGRPSIAADGETVSRGVVLPVDLSERYEALAAEFRVSRSAAMRAGLAVATDAAVRKYLRRQG